ncbi:MAG: type II secretion system protein [Candidatus Muiribacteriota bacterium]
MKLFSIIKKNGFTLIEIMLVVVIISLLTLGMMQSYSYVMDHVRETKINRSLEVLRDGIIQYRNNYGYWPESPEEVVNRGLVRWEGSTEDYVDTLYNDYGGTYNIIHSIKGGFIETTYEKDGLDYRFAERFSPNYTANINPETLFLLNFNMAENPNYTTEQKMQTDHPTLIKPEISGGGDIHFPRGAIRTGYGLNLDGAGLNYSVNVSNIARFTLEFWARIIEEPSGTIFNIVSNNENPLVWDNFNREIRLYFNGWDLELEIEAFDRSDPDNTNSTYKMVKYDLSHLIAQDDVTESWNHFAIVFNIDRTNENVFLNFFINGEKESATFYKDGLEIDLNDHFFTFDFDVYGADWENNIYIGRNNPERGVPNFLSNVILDNISFSRITKSEDDFE